MIGRIHVTRQSEDALAEKVWTFWYDDGRHTLYLNAYAVYARATKRHKWICQEEWSRLSRRDTKQMPIADVPFPDDVVFDAKRHFVSALQIKKERV